MFFTNINNFLAETVQRPEWVVNSFPIIKIVIVVLIALCSIFMIIAVVAQKGNANGITGITGESDTFYNRNRTKSLDGVIKKLTIIDSVLILVLCLLYLVLNTIYSGGLV